MKFQIFILILLTATIFCMRSVVMPEKNQKAYTTMVEAGAKLLELDIMRENINLQQKQLVVGTEKVQFPSIAGQTISVMGGLEHIARGFDNVVEAFIVLEKSLQVVSATEAETKKAEQAIASLTAVLAHPEDQLTSSKKPEYQAALDYPATANFIKAIQTIAQRQFPEFAQSGIVDLEVSIFYDIVRQTIINIFGNLIKKASEKHYPKTSAPKKLLYRAIVNNSAEEVKTAVDAGAKVSEQLKVGELSEISKTPIALAIEKQKPNAVEALLQLGSNPNENIQSYCYSFQLGPDHHKQTSLNCEHRPLIVHAAMHGDFKSALALLRHGANFSGQPQYEWGKKLMEKAIEFFDQEPEICLEFIQGLIDQGYNIKDASYSFSPWIMIINQGGPFGSSSREERQNLFAPIFELLIKNGADINQVLEGGVTPLLVAIQAFNKPAVEFLLKSGVNLAPQGNEGVGLATIPISPLALAKKMQAQYSSANGIEFEPFKSAANGIVELIEEYGKESSSKKLKATPTEIISNSQLTAEQKILEATKQYLTAILDIINSYPKKDILQNIDPSQMKIARQNFKIAINQQLPQFDVHSQEKILEITGKIASENCDLDQMMPKVFEFVDNLKQLLMPSASMYVSEIPHASIVDWREPKRYPTSQCGRGNWENFFRLSFNMPSDQAYRLKLSKFLSRFDGFFGGFGFDQYGTSDQWTSKVKCYVSQDKVRLALTAAENYFNLEARIKEFTMTDDNK